VKEQLNAFRAESGFTTSLAQQEVSCSFLTFFILALFVFRSTIIIHRVSLLSHKNPQAENFHV